MRPIPAPAVQPGAVSRITRIAWAAPCSAIGLLFGATLMLAGATARRAAGTVEFTFRGSPSSCGKLASALPFRAITFGHVIVAVTEQELSCLREHERVHIRQYEQWGPAFFVAYAASSLWALLKGRDPYRHNHFEIQAHALGSAEQATDA